MASRRRAPTQRSRERVIRQRPLRETSVPFADEARERNWNKRSSAVCQRSSGFLARHLKIERTREVGMTEEEPSFIGGGSSLRMAEIRPAGLSATNAGLPVNIS